jgi:NAD(P)H-quinone oxidoreductase subunit 5
MLQCGLGAFSAAMLHIIAHSLYKAHAFLNSGDVLNQAAATRGAARSESMRVRAGFAALGFSLTTTLAIYAAVTSLLGLDLAAKPGGYMLGMILCLGLTRWVWQLIMSRQPRAIPVGLATTTLLSAAYVVSFQAVDAVLASEVSVLASRTPEITPQITVMFTVFVVAAFLALLVLESWLSLTPAVAPQNSPRWLRTAYVHASNGFYIDAALARTTRQLKR